MQEKKLIHVKAKPLISVITLNWNQTELTCQFLASAGKLTYPHYEILVCDLGSATDPTAQITAGNYPNTRILKTDAYDGNGVNRAIQQAKGDFILLINNHTVLTENALENLLHPFLTDSFLGITCPKICSFYKRNEIQYAGYKSLNILTGRKTIIGHKEKDKGQYDTPLYTQGAYSGAMMFRKTVIEQAGMLPGNFFIYFDDADVSARILNKGYKILYQPKAIVYNKEPLFPSERSAINVYYNTRNRIRFMRNNSGVLQFSAFLTYFLVLAVPVTTIRFLIKGQFRHLQSFFKGIWWNIKTRTVA